VPGNIRRAEHFVRFLERFRAHVKTRLADPEARNETIPEFLATARTQAQLDAKPLKMCTDRLLSLLRHLEMPDLAPMPPLKLLCDLASIVGTYRAGFSVILEPYDERTPAIPDPVLRLCCHDASVAMRPVFEGFKTVVITR
jgi:DNA excision repair protein ERCC-2